MFEEESLLGRATAFMTMDAKSAEKWGTFAIIFAAGAILLLVSIPFASFLLLNPKPFCMLFSLGSALILISLTQIIALKKFTANYVSMTIYVMALVSSLYAGIIHIGYINTLLILFIQISTLIYLVISLFPGGRTGLHAGFKILKSQVKGFFLAKQKSFLPI